MIHYTGCVVECEKGRADRNEANELTALLNSPSFSFRFLSDVLIALITKLWICLSEFESEIAVCFANFLDSLAIQNGKAQ